MTDSNSTPNSKFQSMRRWVVDHKLRAVDLIIVLGSLWLSGIAGSIAYNWSQPGMKTSVRIIHASNLFIRLWGYGLGDALIRGNHDPPFVEFETKILKNIKKRMVAWVMTTYTYRVVDESGVEVYKLVFFIQNKNRFFI
ncbi:putative respiratory supercomplex factor 2 [Helianthus annuus]|nr:putative respiratory supercomplex factor 2 [Helianthus annuus]